MLKVIYVMWIRQIKKYLRSKARIASSLGQPILFLIAFGFGLGPMFQSSGQGSYIDFLAPGIIAMSVLFTAVFTGIEVIWDRQFGFLKETLVAPVSRTGLFLGRTLGGGTVAAIQGILVFLITLLIGFKPSSLVLLPVAVLFMFLIGVLFTALGTAIASVLNDMHAFPVVINFFIMPLFFLSGALFPLNNTGKMIALIAKLNPLSYGVDGLRAALISSSHFGMLFDFFVITGCIIVASVVGGYAFSKMQV